jgi:hypothetical protein
MQPAWSNCWERLSITNLSGCNVVISVALLVGLPLGYTIYCCFLFEWGSRDKNYCVNKLWPKRTSLTPGEKYVVSPPFVLREKIDLPPMHIKLASGKILWKVWIKPDVDSNMLGISSQVWVEWRETQGGYVYRTADQGTDGRQTVRWRPEWDWKICLLSVNPLMPNDL